jgi:hypothetical protein
MASERPKKQRSLKDRGKIPTSFYLTGTLTLLLQYYCGIFASPSVSIILNSLISSCQRLSQISSDWSDLVLHFLHIGQKGNEEHYTIKKYINTLTSLLLIGYILFILVLSPFKAGMWAGQKAKRHPMHRYGGLCFLILYGLAWVEYISNYHDDVSADTLLPHVVGLNGMLKKCHFHIESTYFNF